MRLVDYDPAKLKLPDGWQTQVEALEKVIAAESDPAKRAALIDANQDLWKAVKHEMAKLFNYKCWYTEAPQQGTDVDVDHYRPKKRVAELTSSSPQHPGYWWLAFRLENFRYSCIVANRRRRDVETDKTGGKSDHFPLWDESERAWTGAADVSNEQPLLLDPCKAADVALLTFKDDGEAMARYAETKSPKMFKRASTSIEYYHLNHSDFVRARVTLRDEMDKLVRSAKQYYLKLEQGDAAHLAAYEQAVRRLIELRDKSSPYSSFCVVYLEKNRHDDFLAPIFA
jgi:hypothetical protein